MVRAVIWASVATYAVARISQLYADKLPSLLIVILHVVPPAILAITHGTVVYRPRGMLVFCAFSLGTGAVCESLSIRTGVPFGHYFFTGVMGPKVLGLPVLLVFAYLGIGYCSWIVALSILGFQRASLTGASVVVAPALASFVMLAWDLSMEANWSTVIRAWIWKAGGAFYGVPVSNFIGWYFAAYIYYQAFALYLWVKRAAASQVTRASWIPPVALYGICAAGNLLILHSPMAPPLVSDAAGRQWMTSDILAVCSLLSIFVMGPLVLVAGLRLREPEA